MPRHGDNALIREFRPASYDVPGYPGQSVSMEGNENYLPVSVEVVPEIAEAWKLALSTDMGKLTAQFVELDGMQESANPQYTPMAIIGRMENVLVYAGGNNREVTLPFHFRAEHPADVDSVRTYALWLDALKMPWVSSADLSNAPPAVVLTIGNHLQMRAVVTSCTITWLGPYIPGTLTPMAANVDVTFTSVFNGRYQSPTLGKERYTSRAAPSPVSDTSDLPGE